MSHIVSISSVSPSRDLTTCFCVEMSQNEKIYLVLGVRMRHIDCSWCLMEGPFSVDETG